MEEASYRIDDDGGVWRADGLRLDPWMWRWCPEDERSGRAAAPGDALAALAALKGAGAVRRLPVGVIGPRDATPAQLEAAQALGRALGGLGLTVMCGGKSGVMAAVCEGAHAAGGLTVGLLPDADWRGANPAVVLPIATGLSEARNAVIARAAVALVAIGGSYGTLTEVAYGLHFGKTVIGLCEAPEVEGLERVPDVEGALRRLAEALLALPGMASGGVS
jgi:uncharacterized protein (TIGR00725 family)